MVENMFLFSLLTGVFPYTFSSRDKIIIVKFSKLGLITNLCCCAFLTYEILILGVLTVEAIQHQSPSADLKFAIKIANTVFLLVILIRRLISSKEEADMWSKLLKKSQQMDQQWRKQYQNDGIIFTTELLEIIAEYGIFCYVQFRQNNTFYSYDLTLLIRLGFEILVLTMLTTEQRLHVHLNNCLRCDTMKNSLNVHNFRIRLDGLHELRMLINKCYSLDLLLYFVSVQLLMLLECFDWIKMFSNSEALKIAVMVLGMLRIMRLFCIMTYIISRWCSIGEESNKTLEYLFEYDADKFSCHTNYQLELLLDDIQTRNKLFSAHKLYDINMPLLYNICGTVFAYLILIMTSSSVQS
ncbi:uncharacterized protein LOC135833156 [Planococcus citri]|uniref:uncharacterized protein LOC135833156 n=1 Tax=Planococcus citri TaxID=170843 RepID=UPI0031F78364